MKIYFMLMVFVLFVNTDCVSQGDHQIAYPKELSFRSDGEAFFQGRRFTGLLIDETTNKQIGIYENGYLHGNFINYHENGKKKREINYNNGKKHGVENEWNKDGIKIREVEFRGGYRNGPAKEWNSNGYLAEEVVFMNDHIVDGEYELFDDKGNVSGAKIVLNDKIITTRTFDGHQIDYFESGEKKYEVYLNENLAKEGNFIEYWENGSKKSEGNYTNGKLSGIVNNWDNSSFKISEEFYENGLKSGLSTYWQKNGKTVKKTYKDDVPIYEEVDDPANLISNITLKKNEYLFCTLENKKDKLFIKLIIIDNQIDKDGLKQQMVSNLLYSIQNRFSYIKNKQLYENEYITHTIHLTNLEYFAPGHYSDLAKGTFYEGNCSYKIKLFDNQGILLKSDSFNSRDNKSIFNLSHGDKDVALGKAVKKADCEKFMFQYFPIKARIIEISDMTSNRVKEVKIDIGLNSGLKQKITFDVLTDDILSRNIAEIKVVKIYPDYSLCKVTHGNDSLYDMHTEIKFLKLISKP